MDEIARGTIFKNAQNLELVSRAGSSKQHQKPVRRFYPNPPLKGGLIQMHCGL